MAKLAQTKNPPSKLVKVLAFCQDDVGGYGYKQYELDESVLGEPVESSLPDIFAIFVNNLISKSRELFGI